MRATMVAFVFVLVHALVVPYVTSTPLTCADHPAYFPNLNPVLVSSWKILNGRSSTDAVYYPRYTTHRFAPVSDESSLLYNGLDWFSVSHHKQPASDSFIQLNLHRDAKVYLVVGVQINRDHPLATLPGWNSEGWANRVDGLKDEFVYGVHQKRAKWLPKRVYIFSRAAADIAIFPSNDWIEQNISGVNVIGGWYAMIAESDGQASKPPSQAAVVPESILPNQRCPDALHGVWVTQEPDVSDPDVRERMWPTWHPQWDPCYWCAYDHEHGSSALALMNYAPRFGYTPWKNNQEQESHEGFKCTVFRAGSYYVCFCIHAQTSSLRRVGLRTHTIIFAVSDANTRELLADVTQKGFFGFTATRKRGKGFMGVTKEEEDLRLQLWANERASNKRSVNVINLNSLNPEYGYNEDGILRGRYEEWTTNPICSGVGRHGMLHMDIRDPITGIVSPQRADESVNLGFVKDDLMIRHDGSSRKVRFHDFVFGDGYCKFDSDDQGGRAANGVFYTDASGSQMMSGPSKTSVRQFVKRGFSMQMSGHYDIVDPWGGELKLDTDAGQSSDGYGLDPNVN